MDLLVIRHAIAVEREEFEGDDDARPLTEEGRRKMAEIAAGLRLLVPRLDLLVSSPLVRARQTAEIVAASYGGHGIEQTSALTPDAPLADFEKWAGTQEKATLAVVGHEPHLGTLVTWLLSGIEDSRVELKKGAACLVRFDDRVKRAEGVLVWSLTPWQLRHLRE
jgi:phosphohistidine phosphatase